MNMKTSSGDVSNQEILQELRKHTERFDKIDFRLDGIDSRLDRMDSRFDGVDSRLGAFEASQHEILEATNELASTLETRMVSFEREQARMRSNMVTKEYLDDKMADLHSDLVRYTKKELEKALK